MLVHQRVHRNKQLSLGALLWNHLSAWLCKWSTIEMLNFEHGSVGGNRDNKLAHHLWQEGCKYSHWGFTGFDTTPSIPSIPRSCSVWTGEPCCFSALQISPSTDGELRVSRKVRPSDWGWPWADASVLWSGFRVSKLVPGTKRHMFDNLIICLKQLINSSIQTCGLRLSSIFKQLHPKVKLQTSS